MPRPSECQIGGCPGCIYFMFNGMCQIGYETDYQTRQKGEHKVHYSHSMVRLNQKVDELTSMVQYLRNEVALLKEHKPGVGRGYGRYIIK